MKRVRRRTGLRVRVMSAMAALAAIAIVAPAPTNAHAAIVTHTTHVFDVPSYNDPRPFNQQMQVPGGAGCDHIPGVLREGHFFAVTEIDGSRSALHLEMTTHYLPQVAHAAANWATAHPILSTPSCDTLNAFEGKGPFDATRTVLCAAGSAVAGSRYCQLATRDWIGQQTPPQINVSMDKCQNYYVGHDAAGHALDTRDSGFAEWDNLGVYMQTQSGKHVYFDDLNWRSGVKPTEADGTTDLTKPRQVYGKVQTFSTMSTWIAFYDNVARAKHLDPVLHPVAAYAAVDAAVDANQHLTFANPDGPGVVTANLQPYKARLRKTICARAPWVAQALGDASRSDYAQPFVIDANGNVIGGGIPADAPSMELVVGTCDAGFRATRANSSKAALSYLQDFVRHENNGVVPDQLKGFSGVVIPMVIASAWGNTGSMVVRDPLHGCAVQLDLGTGRTTHGYRLVANIKGLL